MLYFELDSLRRALQSQGLDPVAAVLTRAVDIETFEQSSRRSTSRSAYRRTHTESSVAAMESVRYRIIARRNGRNFDRLWTFASVSGRHCPHDDA